MGWDMSDVDHTRECGGDVAAYALGALDDAETDAFRAHLQTCAVCRDELASFRAVVDALPMSAPQHAAPPDLRRRLMRTVEGEARAATRAGRGRTAGRRASRWSLARPVLGLGAALAVAVAVVIGLDQGSSSSTRVIHARVTGPGSAEIRLNHGHAELVVHDFAPPPAGQIYEVWVRRGTATPSPTTALFSVTSAGNGDVEVPGTLEGVSAVMVTPEPAGGTKVPTHPAVISAQLT